MSLWNWSGHSLYIIKISWWNFSLKSVKVISQENEKYEFRKFINHAHLGVMLSASHLPVHFGPALMTEHKENRAIVKTQKKSYPTEKKQTRINPF